MPTSLNSVLAIGKSGIKSSADLAGKTVGTAGLPSDHAYLTAVLEKAGVDPKSVKEVNVSSNLLAAMISGSVDATLGGYRNIEAIELQHRELDPTVMPLTDIGVPHFDELVLLANTDKLESDPEYGKTVSAVLGAIAKGTDAAIADPAAAEQVIAKVAKGYKAAVLGWWMRRCRSSTTRTASARWTRRPGSRTATGCTATS